jgi:hypothetical protein
MGGERKVLLVVVIIVVPPPPPLPHGTWIAFALWDR